MKKTHPLYEQAKYDPIRYDPTGIVSRWSGAARRGTLANMAWAFLGLTLVAIVAGHLAG